MRIVPHKGVRESDCFSVIGSALHDLCQILEIHLMTDPGSRRNNGEVVECFGCPTQKAVPFAVSFELLFGVMHERVAATEQVDLNRMVNNEIDRNKRVYPLRVAA